MISCSRFSQDFDYEELSKKVLAAVADGQLFMWGDGDCGQVTKKHAQTEHSSHYTQQVSCKCGWIHLTSYVVHSSATAAVIASLCLLQCFRVPWLTRLYKLCPVEVRERERETCSTTSSYFFCTLISSTCVLCTSACAHTHTQPHIKKKHRRARLGTHSVKY